MKIFNGTYTIENTKTGEHRTFSLKTQAPDAKFAPGSRILALLNGPDNESNYQGFAFLYAGQTADSFNVWKSKRGVAGKPSAFEVMAAMLLDLLVKGDKGVWFAKGYRLHSANTCIRCNRKLTTPESVKCGIGPDCAEKLGIDRASLAQAFDAARLQAEKAIPSPAPKPVMVKVKPVPIVDDTSYILEKRAKAASANIPCSNCRSSGVYSWDGTVNGVPVHTGICFRCEGKGHQTPADVKRNEYYDNHRPIHGGVSMPIEDEDDEGPRSLFNDDDRRFDEEIQRRDRLDSERAAWSKHQFETRRNS